MAPLACSRLSPPRVRHLGAALTAAILLLTAVSASAQDYQKFALGNGLRETDCVLAGTNLVIDSTPGGDDHLSGTDRLLSGPNGICETALAGDDIRPPTGITLGKGRPNGGLILAGEPGNIDGICDDVITPLGDDVVRILPGRSEPRQVAIKAGTNGVIDSTPGGDDVVTAVICPGTDNNLDSAAAVNPADQVVVNNDVCDILCGSSGGACIIPGTDDVLQTTADPRDVVVPYVSSGANGIGETLKAGDDFQFIALGVGFTYGETVCVTSGADGIAQTTLCANGIDDVNENGAIGQVSILQATQCDDGGTTAGDGCSATCAIETGWMCSGQPSVCTPKCGDGLVVGGELCDDGNTNNRDNCTNTCQPAACGDGFVKNAGTGPNEQCDDGNLVSGDGCDANCKITACGNGIVTAGEACDDGNLTSGDGCDANCTVTGCGNGIVTAGEQCDDGNANNNDDCTNSCHFAACGDGFVHSSGTPPFEQCDDSNLTSGDGCDANCTFTACGNGVITAGETCDDGNTLNGDCCSSTCQTDPNGTTCSDGDTCTIADQCMGGICQGNPNHCGDGVVQGGACGEQCDDGNTTGGDGCGPTCQTEFCGDGIVNDNGTEECDDGNTRNDDACVLGCKNAFCGDGVRERGVEECDPPNTATCDATCHTIIPPRCGNRVMDPGEGCDDGNNSNSDDCLNTCQLATCGDGFIHSRGTPPFEECDDGNTTPGDGCSATCQKECGNGVIDGGCSQGTVGAACNANADCDTTLGGGDGVCIGETCDPGSANLCIPGPLECSNFCRLASCGDGEVACDEECDLGAANGVPGSGCTADCQRTVIGRNEIAGRRECPNAWTLDSPPSGLNKRTQICSDGALCDFDTIPGQCTFRVGVCLSRPGIAACERGKLRTFEVRSLHLDRPQEAAALATLTEAVAALAPGVATIADRCRTGARNQTCTIPVNAQCDSAFGSGDGVCDIGSTVVFFPPLDPPDLGGVQISSCTPGQDVVVQAGTVMRLKSKVTKNTGHNDGDALALICRP